MCAEKSRGRPRTLAIRQIAGAVAILGFASAAVAATAPAARAAGHGSGSTSTTPADSTSRATFSIAPATPHHADQRPNLSFGVTPGATQADHVAVLNFSVKPLSLQVYATDAVNTASGGFGLLPATATPTGAGAWITIPKRDATVRVPAKHGHTPGYVIVPITLRVPDNASPGDHIGGVIASLRTIGRNKTGENVVLLQRVATRLFVRVAGTLKPGLSVTNVHTTYHGARNPFGPGRATVGYVIRNTGNVELGVRPGVKVSGWFGASRSAAAPAIPLLLPGGAVHESASISRVWPEIRLDTTVTATPINLRNDADPTLSPVSASGGTWAIPWTLLALIVVVVAIVVGAVLRVRRRARRDDPKAPRRERVTA